MQTSGDMWGPVARPMSAMMVGSPSPSGVRDRPSTATLTRSPLSTWSAGSTGGEMCRNLNRCTLGKPPADHTPKLPSWSKSSRTTSIWGVEGAERGGKSKGQSKSKMLAGSQANFRSHSQTLNDLLNAEDLVLTLKQKLADSDNDKRRLMSRMENLTTVIENQSRVQTALRHIREGAFSEREKRRLAREQDDITRQAQKVVSVKIDSAVHGFEQQVEKLLEELQRKQSEVGALLERQKACWNTQLICILSEKNARIERFQEEIDSLQERMVTCTTAVIDRMTSRQLLSVTKAYFDVWLSQVEERIMMGQVQRFNKKYLQPRAQRAKTRETASLGSLQIKRCFMMDLTPTVGAPWLQVMISFTKKWSGNSNLQKIPEYFISKLATTPDWNQTSTPNGNSQPIRSLGRYILAHLH